MIIDVDSHKNLMPIKIIADGKEVKKATCVDLDSGKVECYELTSSGDYIINGSCSFKMMTFYAESVKAFDKDGNLIGEYNGNS